jgi:hypothetical protein
MTKKGHKLTERQKELNNIRNREWSKTPKGKLCATKKQWKRRGFNMENFTEIYSKYLSATHCELCNIEFSDKNDGKQRCMDHNHSNGEFRAFLCRNCNLNVVR